MSRSTLCWGGYHRFSIQVKYCFSAADDIAISVIQLSLTSVRVRWSPPSDGTLVSSYQVSYTDSTRVSQGTINVSQSVTSLDITDLIPEETYTFSVTAFGSQGLFDISSMTVTLQQLSEYIIIVHC